MPSRVSRLLPLVLLPVLLVAACAQQGPGGGTGAPGDGAALEGRTFLSTGVTGHQLVSQTRITLGFPEKGKLTATAGCNHLFGDVKIEGDRLSVSGMGGTEMGCDQARQDQDEWLTAFLTAGPKWELAGNDLILTGERETITLQDRTVASPNRTLTGQRWVIDTLLDGEAARSVPQGPQAYLEFQGDGRFTGNTGCNTISGQYTEQDGTLTFSNVAGTKMACAGDQNALERAILSVLEGQVTTRIEGDRLTLVHKTGAGLHLKSTE